MKRNGKRCRSYGLDGSTIGITQLIEIEQFISRDNPDSAIKFVDRFIDRGDQVYNFPYKGSVVPEFSSDQIREVFEKTSRIVYRVTDDQIEILTVFEGHQLLRPGNML